jgi:hypothetical protein
MVTKILVLKLHVAVREEYRLWSRVENSVEELRDTGKK